MIYTHAKQGYTLIELSIVIALIGILMGTALSVGNKGMEKKNITMTDTSLDEIEQAILLFYRQYKRVPCPASPTQAENTSTFGIEDVCSNAAPVLGGIVELNDAAADEQWIGTVPTRSLGLPDRAMYDRWNNRLVYGVQKNFADATKTFKDEKATTLPTMLKVKDKAGNTINPNAVAADLENPVVYVLLSQGKDKRGAYNKVGAQPISCAASNTQKDVENCDFTVAATRDDVFVDTDLTDSTTATNYYYDKLRWKTKINFGMLGAATSYSVKKPMFVSQQITCFIANDNTIKCSGGDSSGAQGNGAILGNVTSFTTEANAFTDWTHLAGGAGGGCGIRSNTRAYCWGYNNKGQAGINSTDLGIQLPTELDGAQPGWTDITKDTFNGCGIRSGRAYCWGDNTNGNLGDGTKIDRRIPVEIRNILGGMPGDSDWTHIAAAAKVSCGIRLNRRLYCWGNNDQRQLGTGSLSPLPEESLYPVEVAGGFSDWVQLSSSGFGMCGIRATGQAYCWGYNNKGQAGMNTGAFEVEIPTEIGLTNGTNGNWLYITYGNDVSCGIRSPGLAYCWGENFEGEGGGGASGAYLLQPRLVTPTITDWKAIHSDDSGHVCAARASGALYCWGTNNTGEFGNASTSPSIVVPTLTTGVTVKVN